MAAVVQLSVGGSRFESTRSTLCRVPGSFFDVLLGDRPALSAVESSPPSVLPFPLFFPESGGRETSEGGRKGVLKSQGKKEEKRKERKRRKNHAKPRSPETATAAADGWLASQRYEGLK